MRAKKNNSRTLNLSVKEQELRRKIVLWRSIQQVYMPYASAVRAIKPQKSKATTVQVPPTASSRQVVETQPAIPSDLRPALSPADDSTDRQELAVDMELCLPSDLSSRIRSTYDGLDTLVTKELRLRLPQCREALASLRKRLRTCARLFDSKRVHTAGTGTRPNTRMQALLDKFAIQRDRDAERYRAARKALVVLNPTGSWQTTLRPLLDSDIRAPLRGQASSVDVPAKRKARHANLESEGRRTLSWIWRSIPQTEGSSDDAAKQELEDG